MRSASKQLGFIVVDEIKCLLKSFSDLEEQEWRRLETLINQTQNNFVDKLRRDYPQLSKNDIHVVMLLRTHFTHEQIARINHVELSSFRKRRCRIKQKMQIEYLPLSQFVKNLYINE